MTPVSAVLYNCIIISDPLVLTFSLFYKEVKLISVISELYKASDCDCLINIVQ